MTGVAEHALLALEVTSPQDKHPFFTFDVHSPTPARRGAAPRFRFYKKRDRTIAKTKSERSFRADEMGPLGEMQLHWRN